jgi:hypothetical protein
MTSAVIADFDIPTDQAIALWREDRYKLLSWWDMERFSACSFYLIGNLLGVLPSSVARFANPEGQTIPGDEKADDGVRNHIAMWVMEIQKHCEEIELQSAVDHAKRFLWRLEREMTYSEILHQIRELKDRIFDSMKGELFLYVPYPQSESYAAVNAFGEEVAVSFPSTAYDIREAHTCYALERPTACVFHLMRVLEVSLVALGTVFGLTLEHTNWGSAIEVIESKIRKAYEDPLWKVKPDWKNQLEFYAQAVSYLGITKEAWRNYTAHARGKFTQEEAKLMLLNVKLFMQKISVRLAE